MSNPVIHPEYVVEAHDLHGRASARYVFTDDAIDAWGWAERLWAQMPEGSTVTITMREPAKTVTV